MLTRFRIVLVSIAILGVSSCATMTIEGTGEKTAKSKTGTHTVHGSFYDFVWSAPPATVCEDNRNIYRARYHTNALYVLVSLVSLGLYVPQTVEWWCDGSPKQDAEEELYHPDR